MVLNSAIWFFKSVRHPVGVTPAFRGKAAAVVALVVAGASLAQAQSYPTKQISVYVAQPPGTGPDVMMRRFAEVMGRNLGQRVLVVNQTGAGGAIAATTVAKAAPDGYTLLLVLNALHTIAPTMHKLPFEPIDDFTFISRMHVSSGVLLVPPQSPARTFGELVTLLKQKGSKATYGSPEVGSPGHFQGALLAEKIGAPAVHVAYRGGSQLLTDLTGGLVDFAFISTVASIQPVLQNQAHAVAVATQERVPALPGVPTLKELGYQEVVFPSWFGIAGPKGLPDEVVRRIGKEIAVAAQDPTIIARAQADHVVLTPSSQDEILKLLASERERVAAAVRRLGMTAQ